MRLIVLDNVSVDEALRFMDFFGEKEKVNVNLGMIGKAAFSNKDKNDKDKNDKDKNNKNSKDKDDGEFNLGMVGKAGVRKPRIFKGKKHKADSIKTKGYSSKGWTKQHIQLLEEFYMDPRNHYANGDMLRSNLQAFAASINRTRNACAIKIIDMKFNESFVIGTVDRRRKKPKKVKFDLKHVKNPEQLKSVFEHFMGRQGNRLTEKEAFVLGVESDEWQSFMADVLLKSPKICKHFKKRNLIHQVIDGITTYLEYGG